MLTSKNRLDRIDITRTEGAFTLIEVLIVVTILSIMIGLAYSAVTEVAESKSLIDEEIELRKLGNTLLLRLTREIALANSSRALMVPPGTSAGSSTVPIAMRGEEEPLSSGATGTKLTFLAQRGAQFVPNSQRFGGLVQVTYRMEEDPEDNSVKDKGYYIVRDETPVIAPVSKAFQQTMSFPVTNRVTELRLSYYNSNNASWVQNWADRQLPSLIKVYLKLKSTQGKQEEFVTLIPIR